MFSVMSPIKAERKFVQIILKMFGADSMMSPAKPGFEVPDHPMNPGENLGGSFGFALNLRPVFESVSFQPPVTVPAIRVDLTAISDVFANERMERSLGHIWNDPQTDSTGMISPILYGNHNRDFLSQMPAWVFFSRSSDVGIVNFNHALQGLSKRVNHSTAQSPAQIQRRSIRTNAQLALKLQSGNSRGQSAHQINRPKPMPEREVAVLKYRSCSDPYILVALMASEPTQPHFPCRSVSTPGTFKTFRPAYPNKIISTSTLGGKAALEFAQCLGEGGISLGRTFPSHESILS
jgi:hypothetical protein